MRVEILNHSMMAYVRRTREINTVTIGVPTTDIVSEAVIDGGANTCLIHHNLFHIIDTYKRRVAMTMADGSSSQTFHGDQWVHVEALVLSDSIIKHIVNTDTVLVYEKPSYDGKDPWVKKEGFKDGEYIKAGYISLQSESHPVEFRKVEIFDLAPYMKNQKSLNAILKELQERKDK